MSEEEKEAIKEVKKQIEEVHNLNDILVFMTDTTTLETLLNLIDKQQKEIEILTSLTKQAQDDVKIWKGMYEELKTINSMQKYRIEVIDERELISKDKIRELREIDNIDYLQFKLKELLGDDE